jgi:hypothetical protein
MANQIFNIQGNRYFVPYPSAALTATPDTMEYEICSRAQGLVLVIDVTAVISTPSNTYNIFGVDRASGKTWTILQSAAIATVSTTVLRVHPQQTASANLIAKDQVPPVIRISSVHGNANSITYSVAGHLTY